MSDREYDYPLNDWNFDELDTIDASEFSLEAILAEFRSAPRDARPAQEESIQEDSPVQVAPIQEEESAEEPADESASVVLTEEENDSDIGSASISSIDELLEPETVPSEPAPDLVEPEDELSEATDEEAPSAEEPSEDISDKEPAPGETADEQIDSPAEEPAEEPNESTNEPAEPSAENPTDEPDERTDKPEESEKTDPPVVEDYTDANAGEYASSDYPTSEPDDDEPEPQRGPALRFGERFITRVVALLALVSAARKQHADAPPPAPDPGYEEAPELPAEKAIRFYAAQRKPLRVRAITSLVVSLVLVWVSFGLPLAGALGSSVRVAALFCLAAECCVMLVGLDVVTHGITAFLQGSPNGESLIVFSCFTTALDALWTAIFGGGSRGLPFCAVSALSLSFALWGGEMYCAGLRTSMRALILGHNPSIITATRDPETGTKHLFKSHSDTEGFIRQSEETDVCEELASVTAPFLMIASLLLAFVASVLRGAPGDFFHVLGAMGAVCAPFSLLYAFPLMFSRCARRLLQIGVGIAGWSGVREFGGKTRLIITDSDVFPPNTIAIDSVRILEGVYTDRVISYAGSVLSAAGSGLAPLFTDLMRRNGYSMQQIDNFTICEGGIRALIRGEEVAIGANGFMNLCGLRIPRKLRTSNAVFISISGTLVGVFGIRYAAIPAVQDALVTLLRGKRSPIFAIRDFNVDPLLIRQKFKLSTEGFHFPSFAERYRLSSLEADKPRRYAAVLARSGLSPFVEAAERGSRLYRSTRFCAFLSLLCSVFGLLLMFLLCWNSSYESASAANLITYMMLWMIPLGVMHFWTRQ